MKEDRSKCATD